MTQFLSEKLSRHLSSLIPGFEGHYGYYDDWAKCTSRYIVSCTRPNKDCRLICPAWQVEDVLRNLRKLFPDLAKRNIVIETHGKEIIRPLVISPDTAYQKIEEYLWTVLK